MNAILNGLRESLTQASAGQQTAPIQTQATGDFLPQPQAFTLTGQNQPHPQTATMLAAAPSVPVNFTQTQTPAAIHHIATAHEFAQQQAPAVAQQATSQITLDGIPAQPIFAQNVTEAQKLQAVTFFLKTMRE